MILALLQGYPDFVGKRQTFVGSGSGPTSYVTGGDPTTLSNPRLYIDLLIGGAVSVSGNYVVYAVPSAVGERNTWKVLWFYATSVHGTVGNQVSAASNLSGEQVQLGGFCGQY